MYAYQQYDPERMARASRRNEAISFKQSVELARELRGMLSDRALAFLDGVIAQRQPVRFTRFTDGAGHKRGIGPGKYPVKAATVFKLLLESAIANAENKGLGTPLKLVSVVANNGNGDAHYGRKRSRQAKSTHLQIVVAETAESKRPKKAKKGAAPEKQESTVKEAPAKAPAKAAKRPEKPAEAKPATEKPATAKPATEKPAEKPAEQVAAKPAAAQPAAKAPPQSKTPPPEEKGKDTKSEDERAEKSAEKPAREQQDAKSDGVKQDGN